jgi:hypothetical protein
MMIRNFLEVYILGFLLGFLFAHYVSFDNILILGTGLLMGVFGMYVYMYYKDKI